MAELEAEAEAEQSEVDVEGWRPEAEGRRLRLRRND